MFAFNKILKLVLVFSCPFQIQITKLFCIYVKKNTVCNYTRYVNFASFNHTDIQHLNQSLIKTEIANLLISFGYGIWGPALGTFSAFEFVGLLVSNHTNSH